MKPTESELIDINELHVGMYVELELGWMAHPFPTGSFKINSNRQIETIRGLGLKQVRWVPARSDPAPEEGLLSRPAMDEASAARALAREREFRQHRSGLIAAQQKSLQICERKFGQAQQAYRHLQEQVLENPVAAREHCVTLVSEFVQEMSCDGESAIRLLSEGVGERAAMHPVNVTVMCLLLGRAMGLGKQELVDLGVAAFLHDVGKLQLPQRVRWFEDGFSIEDFKLYQEHVSKGVAIANRMQLSEGALMAIAQHHEMMDGSGFPMRPTSAEVTLPARILALVNRYDNLCNPARLVTVLTPHEALSLLFAQHKARFDNMVLSAFIRMMGVYPPGSVVQLIDGRYALVVSVNSVRPLKPRVIVHEPTVPRHEALILDMESQPGIGIRRSLKPTGLPADALEYLAPRQRIAYFFENSGPAPLDGAQEKSQG
jgi:HD-GYP domain-containing protein (c-di-GMP phosphodiesterase class II)